MSQFVLLVIIVPKDKSELVMKIALKSGAFGGSVIRGRGTSPNSVIAALGLGDTSKELVYIVAEEDIKEKLITSVKEGLSRQKKHFGILFSINLNCVVRSGATTGSDFMAVNRDDGLVVNNKNGEEKSHELISVILNQGYADDAMAVARKAGAGGGTIIAARGTAKEGDEKFFGVQIVPQKEMLMILVECDKKEAVLSAIKSLPCLSEPGSGIAFCSPVDNFTMLGK